MFSTRSGVGWAAKMATRASLSYKGLGHIFSDLPKASCYNADLIGYIEQFIHHKNSFIL